jgi:hypothetical protein
MKPSPYPGVSLWGEIWGRRTPLWLEDCCGKRLMSVAGEVSTAAPLFVQWRSRWCEGEARETAVRLKEMGYSSVTLEPPPEPITYQI